MKYLKKKFKESL